MNPGPSVWGSANAPVRHGASFSARFPIPGSPCVSDRVCMHECTTWTMVTGRTHAPGVPEFPRFCLHSSLDPSCAFGWREWNPDMPLSWGGSNENESFVKIGSRSNEICLYCAPHVCSLYPHGSLFTPLMLSPCSHSRLFPTLLLIQKGAIDPTETLLLLINMALSPICPAGAPANDRWSPRTISGYFRFPQKAKSR